MEHGGNFGTVRRYSGHNQDIQLKNGQPIIANIIKENVGFLAMVRIILDLLRRSTWLTSRMGNPLRLGIF